MSLTAGKRKRPTSNVERPTSNNSERGGRQPLDGGLEKRAFESRLKWAGVRFADSKLGSDFELRGAMNFQIELAALCQRRAHCLQRQLGRVAIAAEVSEHHALDFSWQ